MHAEPSPTDDSLCEYSEFYILDSENCIILKSNMIKTRDCGFLQNILCGTADPYGCARCPPRNL